MAEHSLYSLLHNVSLQDSVVSFNESNSVKKQPATNLKAGNVTVRPQRLSHIFLLSNPALQSDAWPRGHRATS